MARVTVSINVHENLPFLLGQIDNINQFLKIDYEIILNSNEYMFKRLEGHGPIERVTVNPEIIEKRTFHGSLLKGIYSNMQLACSQTDFDVFIVMSSREKFHQELSTLEQIYALPYALKMNDYDTDVWHWSILKNTKLFQFLRENNMAFSCSAHEGLALKRETCTYILEFLNSHKEIRDDLFGFSHCVEEFALQSLSINQEGFFYIGSGCLTRKPHEVEARKYTYKVDKAERCEQ